MQVKVFKFDKNGKVSFTQAELEKLLNEVYTGGYNDGKRASSYWTWTSPYWTSTSPWTSTTYTNGNATLTAKDTITNNPNITWTTTTNSTDATVTASMHTDDDNAVKINDNVTYTVDTSCLNNYKK